MEAGWGLVIVSLCGAAIGAALGARGAFFLPPSDARPLIATICAILCAAGGYLAAPLVFGGLLQGADEAPTVVALRTEPPQTGPKAANTADEPSDPVAVAIQRLYDNPLIAAIAEAEPKRAKDIKARLRKAHKREGEDALKTASMDIAQDAASAVFATYLPRASDEDLVGLLTALADITEYLAESDPRLCHRWLYSAQTGEAFDARDFVRAIGPEREAHLNGALASVVTGVGDEPAAPDEATVSRVLNGAGLQVMASLGEERIGLITEGDIPETEDDARAACEATELMYRYILFDREPQHVIRALFTKG